MTPFGVVALFAVALLAVIVGFLAVSEFNAVMSLRQRIDKAWSNIDVVLKQRHDQLPALVDAVRGAMSFEQETLARVARARSGYSPTEPIPDQAATSESTSAAVRSLLAVVERYPQLRSEANVLDLQEQIERLEAMIADRRELYNDQVYRYNARISSFPGMTLAALLGWRRRPFFTAPTDEQAPMDEPPAADPSGDRPG